MKYVKQAEAIFISFLKTEFTALRDNGVNRQQNTGIP